MSIKVFTAQECLKAINDDPSKILTIEKKKDDKEYSGTRFMNAYYNIGDNIKKDGWFSIENVALSNGYADPADKQDKRNTYKGTREQLETTVSKAGDFGQFLLKLNPEWIKQAKHIVETDKKADGQKPHELLQSVLSKKNETNPCGPIEDPIVRFQVDWKNFPAKYKHKFLAGQPRTQFFDYRTKYTDENGKVQFKPAVVIGDDGSEEPVNDKNAHKFITKNSIIRHGRLNAPSVPISQFWISHPCIMTRCVIEPGVEDGFSDELNSDDEIKTELLINTEDPVNNDKEAAADQVATTELEPAEVSVGDLTDLLNDM